MKLSIIIPVYNEENTLEELMERVLSLDAEKEVLVVDDASTDATPDVLRQFEEREDVRIFRHRLNRGKGAAIRTAIPHMKGDIVAIQDADLEYDPRDILRLAALIDEGRAEVVYGSRILGSNPYSHFYFYIGGRLLSLITNLLYGSRITDEPTCYKTFDGDLIRGLSFAGNGFEWEPEITAKLLRLGYEIREVPISYRPRPVEQGKKIRWWDGVVAFLVALLWRLQPLSRERRRLLQIPGEAAAARSRRRQRHWLTGVVAAAFVLRLALALPGLRAPERVLFRPDSATYVQPALALLETGRYTTAPASAEPATLRTPGYPLFLALLFALTGRSLALPVIAFCLLSALTCVPVFQAGRLTGSFRVGLVAAGLYALNLTSLAQAPLYLADTLFAFLAAFGFLFFLRFVIKERLLDLALCVLTAAVAALVKPVTLPWMLPCLFLVAVCPFKPWWKRAVAMGVCLFLFALVTGPWMARNAAVGAGLRLDTNAGNTLYYHNAAALMSVVTGTAAESFRQQWRQEAEAHFRQHPARFARPAAREQYKLAAARAVIRRHPLTYLRLHLQPYVLLPDAPTFFELLGITSGGRGTLDVLHRRGLPAAVSHYFNGRLGWLLLLLPLLAVSAVTVLGAVLLLAVWIRRFRVYLALVFLAFVGYYVLIPGPVAMPRYQLPALPMMCVMAASVLVRPGRRRDLNTAAKWPVPDRCRGGTAGGPATRDP